MGRSSGRFLGSYLLQIVSGVPRGSPWHDSCLGVANGGHRQSATADTSWRGDEAPAVRNEITWNCK